MLSIVTNEKKDEIKTQIQIKRETRRLAQLWLSATVLETNLKAYVVTLVYVFRPELFSIVFIRFESFWAIILSPIYSCSCVPTSMTKDWPVS